MTIQDFLNGTQATLDGDRIEGLPADPEVLAEMCATLATVTIRLGRAIDTTPSLIDKSIRDFVQQVNRR